MSHPLTSIVILTRNELAYTTRCVESIRQHTPEPHELVFVDNASTDGTLEYLRSIDGAFVIDNDANLGFGGGCNQGIAASRGERILLLNNDVVVTEGWLDAMHRALDADDGVGIVGPRTNRIAGYQQADSVAYDETTLDGLQAWSRRWGAEHRGATMRVPRLVGFCMLIERAVIERIGGFDLRYAIGNFEDDDFCLRAAVAGHTCAIVHDSWIHHFGSRTFTAEAIDYNETLHANLRQFSEAWELREDELDLETWGYAAESIVRRTSFDASRHYAPLTAIAMPSSRISVGAHRARVVAVACERLEPAATDALLRQALTSIGPQDDVTVVVRIDPRDAHAASALDAIADELGDARLPDIVVVEARDEHDGPLLQVAHEVLVAGRCADAHSALARQLGVTATPVNVTAAA